MSTVLLSIDDSSIPEVVNAGARAVAAVEHGAAQEQWDGKAKRTVSELRDVGGFARLGYRVGREEGL